MLQLGHKKVVGGQKPVQLGASKVLSAHGLRDSIVGAQQTIGNHGVLRRRGEVIQAKLKIGAPNDKYEQEADRVADLVMRMPEPQVRRPQSKDKELIREKLVSDQITPLVQTQPKNEEGDKEELIQAQPQNHRMGEFRSDIEKNINALRNCGQPLHRSTRAFFEQRFGHDFSQVRLHDDANAAKINDQLGAHAFTVGSHIVFGSASFSPGTTNGRRLLTHELAHVVQQRMQVKSTLTHLQKKTISERIKGLSESCSWYKPWCKEKPITWKATGKFFPWKSGKIKSSKKSNEFSQSEGNDGVLFIKAGASGVVQIHIEVRHGEARQNSIASWKVRTTRQGSVDFTMEKKPLPGSPSLVGAPFSVEPDLKPESADPVHEKAKRAKWKHPFVRITPAVRLKSVERSKEKGSESEITPIPPVKVKYKGVEVETGPPYKHRTTKKTVHTEKMPTQSIAKQFTLYLVLIGKKFESEEPKLGPVKITRLHEHSVMFEKPNQDKVSGSQLTQLRNWIKGLPKKTQENIQEGKIKVTMVGHASKTGPLGKEVEYNFALAWKRAQAVKEASIRITGKDAQYIVPSSESHWKCPFREENDNCRKVLISLTDTETSKEVF